jgi:hypothetical protein
VSKIKRVEFITIDSTKTKGHECKPCTLALNELRPIVNRLGVPLQIIETSNELTYPQTCAITDGAEGEEADCIIGWDETYANDVLALLDKLNKT